MLYLFITKDMAQHIKSVDAIAQGTDFDRTCNYMVYYARESMEIFYSAAVNNNRMVRAHLQ